MCTLYRRYGSVSTILGSYRRDTSMPTILRGQHRRHATVSTIFSFIVGADAHRRSAQRRSIVNVHAERRFYTLSSGWCHTDDTISSTRDHPDDTARHHRCGPLSSPSCECYTSMAFLKWQAVLTVLRSQSSTSTFCCGYRQYDLKDG